MKFQTATFSSSALLKGKVMLGEEICSEKKNWHKKKFLHKNFLYTILYSVLHDWEIIPYIYFLQLLKTRNELDMKFQTKCKDRLF